MPQPLTGNYPYQTEPFGLKVSCDIFDPYAPCTAYRRIGQQIDAALFQRNAQTAGSGQLAAGSIEDRTGSMTTRNLKYFFEPKSVALIGASGQAGSLGAVLVQNLLRGSLDAPVYAVNPKRSHVFTLPSYPDVGSIPEVPDLAIVATPPGSVPAIVGDLAQKGTKAVVVITAGFSEDQNAKGHELQQAMLDNAQPHLLRVIGPNCLGIMVPEIGLNASFAKSEALPGQLAFVTQSGAVATAVVDWARQRGIGFSHCVSLGGMSDVDFGDMLDYLALERRAKAILLYVEALKDARKFM